MSAPVGLNAHKLGDHLQHTVGTCVSGWIK